MGLFGFVIYLSSLILFMVLLHVDIGFIACVYSLVDFYVVNYTLISILHVEIIRRDNQT